MGFTIMVQTCNRSCNRKVTKFAQSDGAVLGLRLVIMIPVVVFISLAFIASVKLKITQKEAY